MDRGGDQVRLVPGPLTCETLRDLVSICIYLPESRKLFIPKNSGVFFLGVEKRGGVDFLMMVVSSSVSLAKAGMPWCGPGKIDDPHVFRWLLQKNAPQIGNPHPDNGKRQHL